MIAAFSKDYHQEKTHKDGTDVTQLGHKVIADRTTADVKVEEDE